MTNEKYFWLIVVAALAGCGGGGSTNPGPTSSLAKAASSGDGQHAGVTTALAQPLLALVTRDGAPLAGSTVTWSTNNAGVVITPGGPTGDDGIASATVTFGTVAGPDTIRASLIGAANSPLRYIVVADAGPAAKLGFLVAPHNVLHGAVFTPVVKVAVQDSHGNTVTTANDPITIAIDDNPANGALTGGGPVAALAGVASFPTLSIDSIGDGYTLTASATGLTSASSAAFDVTATPPTPVAITVTVGPGIQFLSVRNGSANPAVDTLAVGGTVTWNKAGGTHNVQSTGAASFPSSFGGGPSNTVMGATYAATFNTAGTYQYDCGIHLTEMTGRVIVK